MPVSGAAAPFRFALSRAPLRSALTRSARLDLRDLIDRFAQGIPSPEASPLPVLSLQSARPEVEETKRRAPRSSPGASMPPAKRLAPATPPCYPPLMLDVQLEPDSEFDPAQWPESALARMSAQPVNPLALAGEAVVQPPTSDA